MGNNGHYKRQVDMQGGEMVVLLGQAFREFKDEKEANNISAPTITNYVQSYEYFVEFEFDGDDSIPVADVFKVYVEQWKDAMIKNGMKITSINHYLRDVRAFLYWCMDEEREYINPPYKIQLVKGQEPLPKAFNKEQVEILLKEPTGITSAYWVEWRTWASICWIIGTGNRAATVLNLKIGDIDFTNKEVSLTHTKSKKAQKIPLSDGVIHIIKKYISLCRKNAKKNDWLFPNVGNEQLAYEGLRSAFKAYCKARGIEQCNLHGLRHYYATEWVRNGGRGDSLQKMLGHSTYDMTLRYIKLASEDLRRDIDTVNPLDKMKKRSSRTKKVRMGGYDEDEE